MEWIKKKIRADDGTLIEAIAPIIISASRSTDIPAFYSKWLFNRIEKGYVTWKNPFNQKALNISFDEMLFIVFWSKNPHPIIPYLDLLDNKNIGYYFQFTLNDYEEEKLEPNIPNISDRISTFISLARKIGKEKIIWRFDPLLLSKNLTINKIIRKIENVGNQIHPYTEKLVFSFADINSYKKVKNNLEKTTDDFREFKSDEILELADKLHSLTKKWNLNLATCAEDIDLREYGIEKNRCIDDELIYKLGNDNRKLMQWLGFYNDKNSLFSPEYASNPKLKDKGQRKACGCIISKDIGMYSTCNHLCNYCYANNSKLQVGLNIEKHNNQSPSII